jgi:hypothetical protein
MLIIPSSKNVFSISIIAILEIKRDRQTDEHPLPLHGIQKREGTQRNVEGYTPLEHTYFTNLFFDISHNSLVLMFIYCECISFVAKLIAPQKHAATVRNYRPLFRYIQCGVSDKR